MFDMVLQPSLLRVFFPPFYPPFFRVSLVFVSAPCSLPLISSFLLVSSVFDPSCLLSLSSSPFSVHCCGKVSVPLQAASIIIVCMLHVVALGQAVACSLKLRLRQNRIPLHMVALGRADVCSLIFRRYKKRVAFASCCFWGE